MGDEYAWAGGCMGYEWWTWINSWHVMNMRLVGYECGMVMRWVETLYSWVEYDELVWIWPGTWKGLVIRVDMVHIHAW